MFAGGSVAGAGAAVYCGAGCGGAVLSRELRSQLSKSFI